MPDAELVIVTYNASIIHKSMYGQLSFLHDRFPSYDFTICLFISSVRFVQTHVL